MNEPHDTCDTGFSPAKEPQTLADFTIINLERALTESREREQAMDRLLQARMVEMGAELAAMREAIREAHAALANVSPVFGRTPAQDATLAKLQPFITT